AVASSFQVLLGRDFAEDEILWWQDSALLSALAMAFFAILFGTRKVHLTEENRGVMMAIAFESVVKLFALLTLAIAAYVFLFDQEQTVLRIFAEHAGNQQNQLGTSGAVEFLIKT